VTERTEALLVVLSAVIAAAGTAVVTATRVRATRLTATASLKRIPSRSLMGRRTP